MLGNKTNIVFNPDQEKGEAGGLRMYTLKDKNVDIRCKCEHLHT